VHSAATPHHRLRDLVAGRPDRPLGLGLVAEGQAIVRRASVAAPGPYQIQADQRRAQDPPTDWPNVQLYDSFGTHATPVVALHRAVASPRSAFDALAIVDELICPRISVSRRAANLLRRLGETRAADAYRRAAELTDNAAEKAFLTAGRAPRFG